MKNHHIKTPLGFVCVAAFVFSSMTAVTPSEARAQDADAHRVYDGCYVPRTGAVYIVTHTPGTCRSDRHVAFSFTYTEPQANGQRPRGVLRLEGHRRGALKRTPGHVELECRGMGSLCAC